MSKINEVRLDDRSMSAQIDTEMEIRETSNFNGLKVTFTMLWGRTGRRQFVLDNPDKIRDVARVLAQTVGTDLHDEYAEAEE